MLAGALARDGVRSRDRVAYLGVHDIAVFETFFAAGLLGAMFVPLNYRLSDRRSATCSTTVARSWPAHRAIGQALSQPGQFGAHLLLRPRGLLVLVIAPVLSVRESAQPEDRLQLVV